MIRKIKFSNFYSFNGEQEIDFTAHKKRDYSYYDSESGDQITKVAGFIGGNASGKTNVMRVFSFLAYFVCSSSRQNSSGLPLISYKPFFGSLEPSNFYLEFEIGDDEYVYDLKLQNNTVKFEKLTIHKIGKPGAPAQVFLRKSDGEKRRTIVTNARYFKKGFDEMEALNNLKNDVSFVAFVEANYKIEIIKLVYQYFLKFNPSINERGVKFGVMHSAINYLVNPELKNKMVDYIVKSNIGVKDFRIDKKTAQDENGEDKTLILIEGIHSTKEGDVPLHVDYESTGTRSLFSMLDKILSAVKNDSVVIIDEIETGLHPEAIEKLIGYFIDENENSKAQLIFSSHSFEFMRKLDMHQIYLVEKNVNGESVSFRLNTVDGVRPEDNFVAKYMSGAYGAFPKIRV